LDQPAPLERLVPPVRLPLARQGRLGLLDRKVLWVLLVRRELSV